MPGADKKKIVLSVLPNHASVAASVGGSLIKAFSPVVELTETDDGVIITIIDASGTHTATVYNGETGPEGPEGPEGKPGVSPTVSMSETEVGVLLTIRDAEGEHSAVIWDGTDGISPSVSVTEITGGHRVEITDESGTETFDVMDGINGTNGTDGRDGFSPEISVTEIDNGHRVSITDAQGTKTFDVTNGINGTDGKDGTNGKDGTDGISPTASVSQTASGATITITDKTGTTTANILNGTNGTDGIDGTDGFSPIATVTKSGNAATISITDKNGTTTAQVTDGTNGTDGTDGTDGVTFTPAVSSAGVISWTNDGGLPNPESVSIKGPQGDPGDDYVLTAQDKSDIAALAAAEIDISGKADKVANAVSGNFAGLDANGNLTDSGSKASDFLTQHQSLADYVQKTDYATSSTGGVVKVDNSYGIRINDGVLKINTVDSSIKSGVNTNIPVVASNEHMATFYGLAKAAGDSTQASSSNAVGTYTDNAKSAIKTMLSAANASDVANVMNAVGTTKLSETYSCERLKQVNIALGPGTYKVSVDSITSTDTDSTQSLFVFLKDGESAIKNILFDRENPSESVVTLDESVIGFYIYAANNYANSADDTCTWTNLKIEHIYPLLDAVNNKVNKTDYATDSTAGLVKINMGGLRLIDNEGRVAIYPAWSDLVKGGVNEYFPIVPNSQHAAAFYGLAKAAGDTTQASSSNAVGTYTFTAKTAIQTMLGVETGVTYVENVSGSTPTITAAANTRYICGEVTSLNFTPCGSGICDLIFTSGSTATVLTVPNTVKWPGWFDPTSLSLNTTYEINVLDGTYGVVAVWGA